jgi:hypothetical protein
MGDDDEVWVVPYLDELNGPPGTVEISCPGCIGVTEKTAKEYCRDARRDEVAEQKAKAWDLWLDCRNYREIAKILEGNGPDEDTVGRWVSAKSNELENADAPESRQHFDIWQFPTTDRESGGRHRACPGV